MRLSLAVKEKSLLYGLEISLNIPIFNSYSNRDVLSRLEQHGVVV